MSILVKCVSGVCVFIFVNLLTPQKVAELVDGPKPATTFNKYDIDIFMQGREAKEIAAL